MNLTLIGHDDRYAVEQLQMALFPAGSAVEAVSRLSRGKTWLTAVTTITLDGKTVRAMRRIRAAEESVRLRRQMLQQCYYLAAIQLLPELPPWGALAGVRPTKITTRHLLEGGTEASAQKLLKDVYLVHGGGCQSAAAAGSVPLCGHSLLSYPVRLLQLCQPQRGQADGAAGAVSCGTDQRN